MRALLPVSLTDGFRVTFGVWLAIDPAELAPVFNVWWQPEYQDLRLSGWLANAIEPWGLLAAPVEACVHDPDETPYCERSSNELLDRVLHADWPHDVVLAAVVPILAIITLCLAFRGSFGRHQKIARWTLPIWLYVSVTGVVVYVMLYVL